MGGTVNLTAGGNISGDSSAFSLKTPLMIEAATLNVNSSGSVPTAASGNIANTSGVNLNINTARVGSTGTLTVVNGPSSIIPSNVGGAITITNAGTGITDGTVTLTTAGTGGSNNITIVGNAGNALGTLTLNAGVGGSITTQGSGVITSGINAFLNAPGAITVTTDLPNITAVSTGGNVSITQINNLPLTIDTSSAQNGGTFSVMSTALITVSGGITVTGGTISLTTTGSLANVSGNLTSSILNLQVGTSIGTVANPFLTDAGTVTATVGTSGNVIVTDSNAGTLTFDAKTLTTPSTGTFTLDSVASQLNIVEAPFAVVGITVSKTANANVLLNSNNSAATVLGGSGAFSVSTTGNIDVGSKTTAINGSSVSLTTTTGSIGGAGSIPTATGGLTLSAVNGSVTATDSIATSSVTGSANAATGAFTLSDTAASGTGLTITSAITGATINLSTTASAIDVQASLGSATSTTTVNSGAALTVESKATVTGNTVDLSGVGNSSNAITLAGTVTGTIITITGTGSVAGIALGGNVTGTGTSKVLITTSGDISGSKTGTVSGIEVDLDSSGGSVGASGTPVLTASRSTLTSNTSLNSFITQNGDVTLGASSGNGTFQLAVTGNLDVTGSISGSSKINLSTTNVANNLTIDAPIGAAKSSIITLTAAGNLTDNNLVTGASVTATAGGNFSQSAAPADIVGDIVSVSSTGSFTANGSFEGISPASTLGLGSAGALISNLGSALGTVANPFSTVTVTMTAANAGTIGGAVNAGTFQFQSQKTAPLTILSGAAVTANNITVDTSKSTGAINLSGGFTSSGTTTISSGSTITVGSTAILADSTDIFTAKGAVTIAGASGNVISDTSLSLTTTGTVTINAVTKGDNIFTNQGTISAGTFSNAGVIDGTNSLNISTSAAGAGALTNTATLTGGTLTLTNGGTGQTSNSLNINAANVTFNTSNLNNTGTVTGTSSLTIQNLTGNLSISGATGVFTTNAGATVLLKASGAITDGTTGQATDPLANLTLANSFTISAGGNFSNALTGITVVPDGTGKGGTINVSASNWLFNGSASLPNFALNALGNAGSGGNITLNLPGTATSGITIGSSAGNFNITATGQGGGGTVSLTTPGQLTVNTGSLTIGATKAGYPGAGAAVFLSGTKGVLINGNLDTTFSGGNPGNITIVSGAKTVFAIGGAAGITNGQVVASGGLTGDVVAITNASGVSIATGDILSGKTSVTINGSSLSNSGFVVTPSLTITSSANVTVAASGGMYPGLTNFNATSTAGSVTISGATPNAGDVTLSAVKGAVIFGTGVTSLTAVQSDAKEDGGTINISAKTLTLATGGLKLNAAAAAGLGGNGGIINVNLTGTTNLASTGKTPFTVFAQNDGAGTNGSISIVTGGTLTVNGQATSFNVGSSKGSGSVILSAKTLHIDDAATFVEVGTDLNTLSLTSNSSVAFALGGATGVTNGISDAGLAFAAGQITITNNGGAIYNGSAVSLQAQSGSPALSITAKGDIGKTSSFLNIDASKSNTVSIKSTTGNAYVSITGGDETYTASAAKTLQITSTGNLTASGLVSAKALNLTAGNIASFNTNATSITANATTGGFTVTDSQTALVTLNSIKANGDVSVTTSGALTTASTITAGAANSVTLMAGGTITTKAAITASQSATLQAGGTAGSISLGALITAGSTLDLTAAGKGTITEAKTGFVATGATVNLTTGAGTSGGNIGTSHTASFRVSAGTLTVNAPSTAASAFINDNNAAAILTSATAGNDYTGALNGAGTTLMAPTVLVSSTSIAAPITTNATSLQIAGTAGNIAVTDSQTNLVKVNTTTATAGSVSISSGGAITTAGIITAGGGVATLTAGGVGAITIGKNITGSTSVTLQTATGAIIESSGIVSGGTVTLATTGGNIGSTSKAVSTNAPVLAPTTGGTTGDVFLANTDSKAAGTVSLTSANVGSLKLTETNTTAKNTGSLTLNDIVATGTTGAITIASNEEQMFVTAGSNVTTSNGNITLQNTYVANGLNLPSITVSTPSAGAITTIHGGSPSTTSTGNVFIALGTVPTASSLKTGVKPTGGTPPPNITGTVFFGTNGSPNGSITTGNSDILTGAGRNLSFTTGKNAVTQINLGQNVTVIADPPATTQSLSAGAGTINIPRGSVIGGSAAGGTVAGGTAGGSSVAGGSSSVSSSSNLTTLVQTGNVSMTIINAPTSVGGSPQSSLPSGQFPFAFGTANAIGANTSDGFNTSGVNGNNLNAAPVPIML